MTETEQEGADYEIATPTPMLHSNIGEMLNFINLSHSQLTEFPWLLFSMDALKSPISSLNLSFNRISTIELPPYHEHLHAKLHLRQLNITCNDLEIIDTLVIPLIENKLEILNLAGNRLSKLPLSIGRLKNLRILELGSECFNAGNNFTRLPSGLSSCSSLQELDISHNTITFLDEWISELPLKRLSAYDNHLTILPRSIGKMKHLETLILAKNKLERVSSSITLLSKLSMLDLSHNQLFYFSDVLLTFLKQRPFLISGNPLKWNQFMKISDFKRIHIPSTSNYNISSLVELCARVIIENHVEIPQYQEDEDYFPRHLREYLYLKGGDCSICKRKYVREYHVEIAFDSGLGYPDIPCKLKLCSLKCVNICKKKDILNDW